MNEGSSKLSVYMPLVQQLSKYAFVLLCLLIFAPRIVTFLDVVEQRILAGSEVSIGPSGIKFGEAPKMPVPGLSIRFSSSENTGGDNGAGGSAVGTDPFPQTAPFRSAPTKGMAIDAPPEDVLHLVHGAAKKDGDYLVKVRLESMDASLMGRVKKVVYHLHSSFNPPTREVTDPTNGFELSLTAWGQFEIKADVYLSGRSDPVRLSRWLNF